MVIAASGGAAPALTLLRKGFDNFFRQFFGYIRVAGDPFNFTCPGIYIHIMFFAMLNKNTAQSPKPF
jgi:hypothetical protein